MNKNSIYIKLNPPYTLDKWKDGGALTREHREFQVLENYIPFDGSIAAREGIVPFAHTPTVTVPSFNPKTDIRCYVVLDFEDGSFLGRNVATQEPISQDILLFVEHMPTRTGSATWSLTDYKEGLASLWITNNTAENTAAGSGPNYYGLQRPGDSGNLKSWMIGAVGATGVDEWLFTGWFKFTSVKSDQFLFQNGDNGIDDYSFGINIQTSSGGCMQIYSVFKDEAGSVIANMNACSLRTNKWYFIGTWCSNDSHSSALYIYDDQDKTESYTSNASVPAFTYFAVTTSRKTIGGYSPSGAFNVAQDPFAFNGKIDYITMWGVLPLVDADKLQLLKDVRDLHKAP